MTQKRYSRRQFLRTSATASLGLGAVGKLHAQQSPSPQKPQPQPAGQAPSPTPTPVASPIILAATDKMPDRFPLTHAGSVRIQGWLGERLRKNELNRLLTKDEGELLRGFQQRPGQQAWVGEHVGKWLHAATLTWLHTGNAALRAKLDRVAAALIATQQPDGYLGTYANGAHWGMGKDGQWDVWVHKYNLIGLLTYAKHSAQLPSAPATPGLPAPPVPFSPALNAARRIGDLLLATFGAPAFGLPSPLDLNERSTHAGMASGSLLEPMVLLWRATGDQRYLDFARSIADKWESPNGPKLISALAAATPVNRVANGKAYEMLSCLVGLCELYRATGEPRYLNPVLNAWLNIVNSQLLITGSASSKEHWTEPKRYPSQAPDEIAETCVTVTWLQLNQQLLRLLGQSKYADEIERTLYNHLAAAQRPDGAEWCYFTPHNGKKSYQHEQNCCTSSGPRGWALLPSLLYQVTESGIVVNLFANSTAALRLNNGKLVTIRQETSYPVEGRVTFMVSVPEPMKFALRVRVPAWSQLAGWKSKPGDYWTLRQTWSRTQTITLDFTLPVRALIGEGQNVGRVALARGPVVLAADEQHNSALLPLAGVALASPQISLRSVANLRDAEGWPFYEIDALMLQSGRARRTDERIPLRLNAFANAGATGKEYAIWFGAPVGTITPQNP